MNLPTNNTAFRNAQQNAGINLQNKQNTAFVYRTQTLVNNGDTIGCSNNTDCAAWPGTTCNSQSSSWKNSHGNQGNYCATTIYPELETGNYFRKLSNEGGIGKGCNTNNDCGEGFSCNNEFDIFGRGVQQTGYCAQKYSCPDGSSHFLGYPYNSGVPVPPQPGQNSKGNGYKNYTDCSQNKLAQQDCKQNESGKWFAVYPGYCPVPTNLRNNDQPQASLIKTSNSGIENGIKIPSYGNSVGSSIGTPMRSFESWNINSEVSDNNQMSSPLQYELSINPRG